LRSPCLVSLNSFQSPFKKQRPNPPGARDLFGEPVPEAAPVGLAAQKQRDEQGDTHMASEQRPSRGAAKVSRPVFVSG
jgi:hypothetical protein